MNKEQVRELLKTVKYPGFSRDIVSFGMISTISVRDTSLTLELNSITDQQDKINAVIENVRQVLESTGSFSEIKIDLVAPPSAPAKVGPSGNRDPFAHQGPLPGVRHVVAIASGKGGVGKTTIAVNLAATLHNRGYRVGLLDLDIYGPSLPIVLGINERPLVSENNKLIPLERYGLRVMSFGFISGNDAPAVWRGPMVAKMTEQFFNDVEWGELDFLILDLPPGTGDVQLTLVQKLKISGAVMVTTPQDIAVADVSKGADMFRKVAVNVLGVIENMSGLRLSGRITGRDGQPLPGAVLKLEGFADQTGGPDGEFEIYLDLFKKGGGEKESRRLNVPLLGEIPLAREVMEATDSGQPLVSRDPTSPISRIYDRIAAQIIKQLEK
ncbi:MAG: Mrp/NBP35 family ATP-binding protein [Candidatus Neomarinimicrobiota bacterium]